MLSKAPRLVVLFVFAIIAVGVPLACSSSDSSSDAATGLPGTTTDGPSDMTRAG